MPWSEWILTAATAVSLGDSYAVRQTLPIEEQLRIPTIALTQGGSFASTWLYSFEGWSQTVLALDGPVLVFLTVGTNDERATPPYGRPPQEVAQTIKQLILSLLLLREDLVIVQTGYNGMHAQVSFSDFLPPDGERYTYVETRELDQRIRFGADYHPDPHGYSKRIRHVIHEIP